MIKEMKTTKKSNITQNNCTIVAEIYKTLFTGLGEDVTREG
jgi:hypothetical protein